MAVTCLPVFGICRTRVTVVDAQGNVTGATYVTDQQISVAVNPNIDTGNSFTARNGCGCAVARFKSPDTFNWWEFTFVNNAVEPQLEAFLLGATTIDDGGVVGIAYPATLACDEDEPAVAFEFWVERISGSGQDGTFPWVHFCYPMTIWQVGNNTYDENFGKPTLTGFSRTNSQWGEGPFGDGPPDAADISDGGYWFTDVDPPSADCAAGSVTPSS